MKEYTISILSIGKSIQVQSNTEIDHHGLPGSLLSIVNVTFPDIIPHACGGVVACATCHVLIEKGLASCSPITEREEDMLDNVPLVKPNSRLACCCIPSGEEDIEINLPFWGRHGIKE